MAIKRVGELLKFNVSIPLWIIITSVSSIAIICYLFFPNHQETIKFISLLLGAAAAIYSAYYVGASLRLGLISSKMERSFKLLSIFSNPTFVKVRKFLTKETDQHLETSPIEFYEKINSNTELQEAVTMALGIFEDMSIAIQNNHIDEDIMYTSLGFMVPFHFSRLKSFIGQERIKNKSDIIFIEVEKLYNSWNRNLWLSDGKPLPKLG